MRPGEPAAVPASAAQRGTDEEVQSLLLDIFARTGQKVQADDPLVAAALIHSALLRRAGQEAALAIDQAAQRARESQPIDRDVKRAIGWLGLWHTQVMLGTVLVVLCFLASALGSLLATSACH